MNSTLEILTASGNTYEIPQLAPEQTELLEQLDERMRRLEETVDVLKADARYMRMRLQSLASQAR